MGPKKRLELGEGQARVFDVNPFQDDQLHLDVGDYMEAFFDEAKDALLRRTLRIQMSGKDEANRPFDVKFPFLSAWLDLSNLE